jgi:hypothetical protein
MEYINKLNSLDKISVKRLINLNKKEKDFLKNFDCNKSNTYDYYGGISNAKKYLIDNIIDSESIDHKFIKIIMKIINRVKLCYPDKDYIWLRVKVRKSYRWKDIRWHMDDFYYPHGDDIHSKFIATLCGPPTYGVKATIADKKMLNSKNVAEDGSKRILSEEEQDLLNSKKININYSIIKVGRHKDGYKNGLIHSEPICTEPNTKRVFISILYMTESEISFFLKKKNS